MENRRPFLPTESLESGVEIEVRHGPMKGIVGELIRRGTENILVIRVNFIGVTAELEIDEALIRVTG